MPSAVRYSYVARAGAGAVFWGAAPRGGVIGFCVGDDQSLFIGKCLREDVRQAVENTDADLHGYGICRRGQSGGNTLAVTHRMVFLL